MKLMSMAPPPKTCAAHKPPDGNKTSPLLREILKVTQGPNANPDTIKQAEGLNPQLVKPPQMPLDSIEERRAVVLGLNEKWDPILEMVRGGGKNGTGNSTVAVNTTAVNSILKSFTDLKPEEIWAVITKKLEAKNGVIKSDKLVGLFKDKFKNDSKAQKAIEEVAKVISGFYYSPVARTFTFHQSNDVKGTAVMGFLRKLPAAWRDQLGYALRIRRTNFFSHHSHNKTADNSTATNSTATNSTSTNSTSSSIANYPNKPNDPLIDFEWGLTKIAVPQAWQLTTGSKNVVVAVVDSGIDYNHKDLKGNMWKNKGEIPGNGIDDDGNGYIDDVYGFDFFNKDGDPMDDYGHGTHVAGVIGATGHDGYGVVGVAQNVSLMALKVLDLKGNGRGDTLQQALDYAILMGAHITTNSYASTAKPIGQGHTLKEMEERGMLLVAAAGNDRRDNNIFPAYPGSYRYKNIISVAASDMSDCMAPFSNYGDKEVDLAAPGVYIYSAAPSNVTNFNKAEHVLMDGTSMATPFVTGVAALMLAAYEQQGQPITGQGVKVREIILSTVDKFDIMKNNTVTGGRVNANKAVQVVLGKSADRAAKIDSSSNVTAAPAAPSATDEKAAPATAKEGGEAEAKDAEAAPPEEGKAKDTEAAPAKEGDEEHHKEGEHKEGEHKEGEHKEGEHNEGDGEHHKEGEHKEGEHEEGAHKEGDGEHHKEGEHEEGAHKEGDAEHHKEGEHEEGAHKEGDAKHHEHKDGDAKHHKEGEHKEGESTGEQQDEVLLEEEIKEAEDVAPPADQAKEDTAPDAEAFPASRFEDEDEDEEDNNREWFPDEDEDPSFSMYPNEEK